MTPEDSPTYLTRFQYVSFGRGPPPFPVCVEKKDIPILLFFLTFSSAFFRGGERGDIFLVLSQSRRGVSSWRKLGAKNYNSKKRNCFSLSKGMRRDTPLYVVQWSLHHGCVPV